MFRSFFILIFLFLMMGSQLAQANVPIPDIKAKIEELGPTLQAWDLFIKSLISTYTKSTDVEALANIREFCAPAREKMIKLAVTTPPPPGWDFNPNTTKIDDYWMIRDIDLLDQIAVKGLMEFGPLDPARLIQYYGELRSATPETPHSDVLTFFMTRVVPDMANPKVLRDLITFGQGAKTISIKNEEPDWLIRQVEQFLGALTTRLLQVDPYLEGVYAVTLTCESEAVVVSPPPVQMKANPLFQNNDDDKGKGEAGPAPAAKDQGSSNQVQNSNGDQGQMIPVQANSAAQCARAKQMDRLVVLGTGTGAGVLAVFFSSMETRGGSGRWQTYPYSGATAGTDSGSFVEGDISTIIGLQNTFMAGVDPDSGKIAGWLMGTRQLGNVRFSGSKLISPSEYFREDVKPEVIDPKLDLPGQYRITFEEIHNRDDQDGNERAGSGKLIIKEMHPRAFKASYRGDNGRTFIEFATGSFTQAAQRGIVFLSASLGGSDYVKWVMASVDKASGKWKGMGYSTTNGSYYRFSMVWEASVQPMPQIPVVSRGVLK